MAGNANSGRRVLSKELAYVKKKLEQVALEELAKTKIYCHLEKLKSTNRQGVKEIALPIYLKSKTDKSELKLEYNPIYNGQSIQKHKGDETDIQTKEENKSGIGGNECEQDD